jgi:thiosulfate dehydrogenase [quinone] large subunit
MMRRSGAGVFDLGKAQTEGPIQMSAALSKTIAVVRMATGVFFILFGQYKLSGPGFAHGGFQEYLRGYIAGGAVSFYRPILASMVLPHAVFLGYMVGVVEMLIGVSLLVGIWVRPASILGALFMLNLALATWWEPGHGVPLWRYFGAELDKLPLLFLFVIFFVSDAGREWGLDGRLRKAAGRP